MKSQGFTFPDRDMDEDEYEEYRNLLRDGGFKFYIPQWFEFNDLAGRKRPFIHRDMGSARERYVSTFVRLDNEVTDWGDVAIVIDMNKVHHDCWGDNWGDKEDKRVCGDIPPEAIVGVVVRLKKPKVIFITKPSFICSTMNRLTWAIGGRSRHYR